MRPLLCQSTRTSLDPKAADFSADGSEVALPLVEGITCQNARDFATVIDGTSQSPLPESTCLASPATPRESVAWKTRHSPV